MSPKPAGIFSRGFLSQRWMRLGIATLTSTALVGGTLVAAPTHPLIPASMVAQANAQTAEERLAFAEALLIDLDLLRGVVTDETALDSAITAIHSQQAWPLNDGEPADKGSIDLALLQAIELNLGAITLPLVDNGATGGLLRLGEAGAALGALGSYAHTPDELTAIAATGVANEDGSVNLDATSGPGNVDTSLQLTALLNQLGLGAITDQVADDLSLRLGAVGSQAEADGDIITAEYAVAGAELYLHSPALEEVGTLLSPGTVGGLGAGLDDAVDVILGNSGLADALLGPITSAVSRVPGVSISGPTLTTNVEATLANLIQDDLVGGDGLVEIKLSTGEVRVNLEMLHSGNLSNLDPNTPLVNSAELTRITDALSDVLGQLNDSVANALRDGILATSVEATALVLGTGLVIDTTLGGLLAGDTDGVTGSLLGMDLGVGTLVGLLGGVIGDTLGINGVDDSLLGTDFADLLPRVTDGIGLLLSDTAGLGAVIDTVLAEVAQVTINYQPNVLVPNGDVATRPNARIGTVADPTVDFSIQPVHIELLSLGTGGGNVSLPLARSTVAAQNAPVIVTPVLTAITPDQGPRSGGHTVTLTGENFSYTDILGDLVEVDTVHVGSHEVTEFTIDPINQTITFVMPAWDDLGIADDTVGVSVSTSGKSSNALDHTFVDTPQEELFNPGYDWVTIRPGTTVVIPQTGDASVPADATYAIDPAWGGPSGWNFEVSGTGDLSITAPEDAPIGLVFEVPVIVEYADGSTDNASARTNVVTDPFHIVEIINDEVANTTTIVFSDGSEVVIEHGVDGTDGTDGAKGDQGEAGVSLTIKSQTVDEAGNTTITFSDDSVLVIPAGKQGDAGVDGAQGDKGDSITVVGSEVNAEGDLEVEFSDGTIITVPQGEKGADGEALTVVSTTIDAEGNTVITLSDGSVITIAKGDAGADGLDGTTPSIGDNGNWWIGDVDTGIAAEGVDGAAGSDGTTPHIGDNGNWWIGDSDTGIAAEGKQGDPGADGADGADGLDGTTPSIGDNGNWWIGTFDTGIPAEGADGANGLTPHVGDNGNWWVGIVDTGVSAEGPKGDKGDKGDRGPSGIEGVTGSSKVGECLAGDTGNILALLAVLGTAAAVGIPLLEPLARTIGHQIGIQVAPGSSQGANQPAWLVQVNRTLGEVSRSTDSGAVIAAVVGAGILAAFSVAGEACSNEGNLSS